MKTLFILISFSAIIYSHLPLNFTINTDNYYINSFGVNKQKSLSNFEILKNDWHIFYSSKDSIYSFALRNYYTPLKICNIKTLIELRKYKKKPKICQNLVNFKNIKARKINRNISIVRINNDVLIFDKTDYLIGVLSKGYNFSEEKFQEIINSIKYNNIEEKKIDFYMNRFNDYIKKDKLDSAFEALASAFILEFNNTKIKQNYKKLFKRKKEILEFQENSFLLNK